MSKGGYNQGKPNNQRMQAWGAKDQKGFQKTKKDRFLDNFQQKVQRKRDAVKFISS